MKTKTCLLLAMALATPLNAQDPPPAAFAPVNKSAVQLYKSDIKLLFNTLEKRLPKAGPQPEGLRVPIEAASGNDQYKAPPFRSGEERVSRGKQLETHLSIVYGDRKAWRPAIFNPVTNEQVRGEEVIHLKLRSYDGLAVGPTLRVKPGDVLRVNLHNKLPVQKPVEHDQNTPERFNRTNLHTHGLHVTPAANGDNVLLEILPGEKHLTEIAIAEDHLPGTFWYHSHVHGTTAMQVSSGMAGALIIGAHEDDARALDNLPGIKEAEERIMVLQQLSFTPAAADEMDPSKTGFELENFTAAFGGINDPAINPQRLPRWNLGKIREGWRTTINGQLMPVMRIKSGKTQRLRLIHGGVREVINIQVAPIINEGADYQPDQLSTDGMREIARDGLAMERMRPTSSVQLYPGYRSDVLLKLNNRSQQVQRYALWDGVTESDRSLLNPVIDNGTPTKEPALLALIEVEPATPETVEVPWPAESDFANVRRPAPIAEHELHGRQQVVFGIGGAGTPGLHINGLRYDHDRAPWPLQIGRADEWLLSSKAGNHPFHIHVNPFFLKSSTAADGTTTQHHVWKDTLLVNQGTQYRILTRYEKYLGPFVIHCHILDHEDVGMMQGVEVVNSAYETGTKLARPYHKPLWTLPDTSGAAKPLAELLGPNLNILVFLESQGCARCNQQMEAYRGLKEDPATPFPPDGVNVIFIAPGARPQDGGFPGEGFPFPVFFDETMAQFKEFGVYQTEHRSALHGTFLMSREGKIFWRGISHEPWTDIQTLLRDRVLILDQLALEAARGN